MASFWEGLKDIGRSIPVFSDIVGLDSPEEIAARRQRRGLSRAEDIMREETGSIAEMYDPIAGLAGLIPQLSQRVQAGEFQADLPQLQPFEFEESCEIWRGCLHRGSGSF